MNLKSTIIVSILLITAVTSYAQQVQKLSTQLITIGVTDEIKSKVLSEDRKINIYLPEGYKQSDTAKYPVIYLLDGGLDEDFIHIVGLVQFNTFPWVHQMPQSIVVGVVNIDRQRDMTFPTTIKSDKEKYPTTGGSQKFIAYIEKELQPYIEKKYRTNGTKTIIGESLGGLLATEILFEKPAMFDNYIIISPSLWWDNGSMLKKTPAITATYPSKEIGIYIGVGKEGLAPSPEPHVMEVDANVLLQKLKDIDNKHIKLYFDYLPNENHATIMYQAVYNAVRTLYDREKVQ